MKKSLALIVVCLCCVLGLSIVLIDGPLHAQSSIASDNIDNIEALSKDNGIAPVASVALQPLPMPETEIAPCTKDCGNDNWTGPTAYGPIFLPNGCQVTFDYWTRNACGTYNDIQITKLKVLNPGACSYTSLGDLLDAAMEELMEDDPMGWAPSAGECVDTWRASKGSCWEEDASGAYVRCANFNCCQKRYLVCKDFSGDITVTVMSSSTPANNTCPGSCIYICS